MPPRRDPWTTAGSAGAPAGLAQPWTPWISPSPGGRLSLLAASLQNPLPAWAGRTRGRRQATPDPPGAAPVTVVAGRGYFGLVCLRIVLFSTALLTVGCWILYFGSDFR